MRSRRTLRIFLTLLTLSNLLLFVSNAPGQPVPVRHTEGLVHGFLVLRSMDGKQLATGDLMQTTKAERVTSRLTFHFTDGSLHDETTVFTQHRTFRVLSDHLVQKGPSFPQPVDVMTDALSGEVKVHYTDKDGKEKDLTDHLNIGPDLANGIIFMVLKDINPKAQKTTLSMVAASPKPRVVKLEISPEGEDTFTTTGAIHKATRFLMKVDIGGVAGVVAPLMGKQPADTRIWILGGTAPAFIKSEGPLYGEGPVWRVEMAEPRFGEGSAGSGTDNKNDHKQ